MLCVARMFLKHIGNFSTQFKGTFSLVIIILSTLHFTETRKSYFREICTLDKKMDKIRSAFFLKFESEVWFQDKGEGDYKDNEVMI